LVIKDSLQADLFYKGHGWKLAEWLSSVNLRYFFCQHGRSGIKIIILKLEVINHVWIFLTF